MPMIKTKREWTRTIGRYKIRYEHRSKDSSMGRFGGGWQWQIGVQWGKTSAIFNLLVAMLRISKSPLCHSCGKVAHYGLYKGLPGSMEWLDWHKECYEAEAEAVVEL